MFHRIRQALVAGLALVLTVGLGAVPAQAEGDILAQLKQVPGLTVISESPTPPAGYRFFVLSFTQPVDHRHPNGPTFQQRFQLLHKSVDRPMVLHTSGYNVSTAPFRSEPTRLIDGNQISTEQRFFLPSRPDPANWHDLDIWQAATDHHTLIQAMRKIYHGKWISTGASKGGMATVYHRRFYPRDIDGSVAYVAPNDVINNEDSAYDRFFASVGDASCRQALEDVQAEALRRRSELVPMYAAWAAANGRTFTQVLGNVDKAFEMTVLDTEWAFWQYSHQSDCPTVPAKTASTQAIYDFINQIDDWSFYTDQGVLPFEPYYYQAATQLGWPSPRFDYLRGLTHYPPRQFYAANSNLPPDLRSRHNPFPMLDVDFWVRTQSSQMLFVYGSDDPWGAEPFFPSHHDSYKYIAPGANHGANIAALVPAERDAATKAVQRWANVTAPAQTFSVSPLDQEPTVRRPL
ncbi:S28 family serine protease [Actinocrispum wychmicini]|uniref:PS-10 peptidase S37 n=1 Tax=Actinocrispum wychmicini TaxID=1213861 RepID=A0A4R2JRX5_9PSEU|nr:S28 family serine protease [Actinocrispum wychmicini]TCO56925.1 PS-10 peptidase S37 [Actinocrispum wychmicini]